MPTHKMEHYYTPKPSSKIIEHSFSQLARGQQLSFITASGLFSQEQIDTGSLLLIEKGILKKEWCILDLGCGYGPVGISFKKSEPTIHVTFTDVNTRAVEYTEVNLRQNNIPIDKSIELVNGDGFDAIDKQLPFDAIYLNPPQSAGKDLCFNLIEKSKEHLKIGGNLQIVARKNKGGETLAKHMESVFGNVEPIAKQSGFWVYISYKK